MKFRLLKVVSFCAMLATPSFVYAVNNIEVWKSPTLICPPKVGLNLQQIKVQIFYD